MGGRVRAGGEWGVRDGGGGREEGGGLGGERRSQLKGGWGMVAGMGCGVIWIHLLSRNINPNNNKLCSPTKV